MTNIPPPTAEDLQWIEDYRRYTGVLTSKAMKRKALAGDLPGCAPVGYVNKRVDGVTQIIPDNKSAPLVREAFDLAAQGSLSLRKILAIMTEKGLKSRNSKTIGVSGLWNILTNPFYIGDIRYGDQIMRGNHESIIDDSIFLTVQASLRAKRRNKTTNKCELNPTSSRI